jgi:hypothetical protein
MMHRAATGQAAHTGGALACLLHDISTIGFIRGDHGYWGAQLVEPYVDGEVPQTRMICERVSKPQAAKLSCTMPALALARNWRAGRSGV